MTEDKRTIEASEEQVQRLTRLYRKGLNPEKRFISIDKLSYDEWLILRSIAGIGASEISTALGKNPPYFIGTPLKVWKEKVGHLIEIIDTPKLRIGRNIEDTIRKEYIYLTGRTVTDTKDKMFIHPEFDELFANLDGVIEPAGGDKYGVLECKATTSYVYESWIAKLPPYYFRQAMAELNVADKHPAFNYAEFDYVDFAVYLIDRWEVAVIRINKDQEFIDKQNIEILNWHNDYVVANTPPPESVAEWARTDPMEDSYIEASSKCYGIYEELLKVKRQQKDIEEKRAELEDEIKAEMKDSESLIYSGEVIATWKQQQKTSIDSKKLKEKEPKIYEKYSKTSMSRVLRLKEITITEY